MAARRPADDRLEAFVSSTEHAADDRLPQLVAGALRDPHCRLVARAPALSLSAMRYRQLEPVWGGTSDPARDGRADLAAKLIRHVGSQFREDPLRVLRGARLAAQLPGFALASETGKLFGRLAGDGALNDLDPQRVWGELHKAMSADAPRHFIEVLRDTGVLAARVALPKRFETLARTAIQHHLRCHRLLESKASGIARLLRDIGACRDACW